mgnify:FL=1
MDVLEFCYNVAKHSATGFAPFTLSTGKDVMTPLTYSMGKLEFSPQDSDVDQFLLQRQNLWDKAKQSLEKSKLKMQLQCNKHRVRTEFFVGDWVLVSAENWPLLKPLTPKFNNKFFGPFQVLEVYNGVSYKLALPESIKIHDVFHISLLCRFNKDEVWGRTDPTQLIPTEVLKHRMQKGRVHYLIKWKDRAVSDQACVPESKLLPTYEELLRSYYTTLE